MRIAYLTGRYPDVSHTFILREVEGLRGLGLEVDTFSIWRTKSQNLLSEADRQEHERTYAVLPPRPSRLLAAHAAAAAAAPLAYLGTLLAALRLGPPGLRGKLYGLSWHVEAMVLWRECRRRGISHVHAHLNGTAPAVALLMSRFGRRAGDRFSWSLTVHGPTEFYDVAKERLVAKLHEADFVVAISDFAKSQLMAHLDERHWPKLEVVHCGVPVGEFHPPERAERGGRPGRILTVGRLAPQKGQAVLIEAVAQLRRDGHDLQLTIVGDGPKRPVLEERASEHGVADRVEFTGAVGQDEIRDHYAAADVFCLSSFAEGVPVVLMEAMATGLPVVAPRIMGIGELVEHEKGGLLVRPARADELAQALERLLDNPDLRARLGAGGRRKVEEEFDASGVARELHDVFRERVA
jgi:colanic acid/amylovoran biosynthesis glycosyltransferase